jgi:ATP phosphoribosyltransferase
MEQIRLAVQKQGRLSNESMRILEKIGVGPENGTRSLFSACRNYPMDLLWLRDDDIPQYVKSQTCDLGIVGENVLREKQMEVEIIRKLDFGKCQLALLAPPAMDLEDLSLLNGKKIATSYPNLTRSFLREHGIQARIVEVTGSVEIAPRLEIADAVIDLVSTGQTAKLNGLEIKKTLLRSEAVLFAPLDWKKVLEPRKVELIVDLVLRIQSTLNCSNLRYLMMNAPKDSIDQLVKLLPGSLSPTILDLKDKNMAALHVIIREEEIWKILPKAKRLGATDFVSSVIDAYMP